MRWLRICSDVIEYLHDVGPVRDERNQAHLAPTQRAQKRAARLGCTGSGAPIAVVAGKPCATADGRAGNHSADNCLKHPIDHINVEVHMLIQAGAENNLRFTLDSENPDPRTVFLKLRELRNDW